MSDEMFVGILAITTALQSGVILYSLKKIDSIKDSVLQWFNQSELAAKNHLLQYKHDDLQTIEPIHRNIMRLENEYKTLEHNQIDLREDLSSIMRKQENFEETIDNLQMTMISINNKFSSFSSSIKNIEHYIVSNKNAK